MATTIFPTVNDVGGSGAGKVLSEANLTALIKMLSQNFVVSGFTLPSSDPDLVIPVAAGEAMISGYRVVLDAATNVTCTANATNHIYLKLNRDASGNVTGATFEVNTTGTAPADAVKIGMAVAGASSITSTTDARPLAGLRAWRPGDIKVVAYSTPEPGWLECNGAAVSRSAYAALFAAIGTTFGAGDGTTTFNLPDLRGEFIRGWDHGRGVDPGRALGSWQADELKSHRHTTNFTGYYATGADARDGFGYDFYNDKSFSRDTTYTGGSETRPRNVAFMFVIKY
ncbi:MAG: phage tail protein [Betaproteobacteria bacterium]